MSEKIYRWRKEIMSTFGNLWIFGCENFVEGGN